MKKNMPEGEITIRPAKEITFFYWEGGRFGCRAGIHWARLWVGISWIKTEPCACCGEVTTDFLIQPLPTLFFQFWFLSLEGIE
jgi:hypothetical protein